LPAHLDSATQQTASDLHCRKTHRISRWGSCSTTFPSTMERQNPRSELSKI